MMQLIIIVSFPSTHIKIQPFIWCQNFCKGLATIASSLVWFMFCCIAFLVWLLTVVGYVQIQFRGVQVNVTEYNTMDRVVTEIEPFTRMELLDLWCRSLIGRGRPHDVGTIFWWPGQYFKILWEKAPKNEDDED